MKHLHWIFVGLPAMVAAMLFTGCAAMAPDTDPANFGSVLIGNSASATVTWTNVSDKRLNFIGYMPPDRPFARTLPNPLVGGIIPVGGSAPAATFSFTPTAVGTFNDTASPLLGDREFADEVLLTGVGISHSITGTGFGIAGGDFRSNQVLDFGTIRAGQTATLKSRLINGSANTLSMTGTALRGGPFSVTAPVQPIVIQPSANVFQPTRVRFDITFAPGAAGQFLDHIRFTDPANPGYALTIVVTGKAVRADGGD